MVIQLLAKHFKEADYDNATDCPISRAIREQSNFTSAAVGITVAFTRAGGFRFEKPYAKEHYSIDFDIAKTAGFDETPIREIKLTQS